ncbi:MarR family transcriptional regulator [Planktotalea sp.]|uniref:MarR family winged helix-turn-helix transcriptional regulator n=1 Tax=Planktotalea sp. TaxID=2029877 RepID=UPI0032970DCD
MSFKRTSITSDPKAIASTPDALDTFVPYLMNRIARRYNVGVEDKVRSKGLNVPRLRVLAALAVEGSKSVNDLSVYAISEQSTISRLLDQMTQEGLVERKPNPNDNRSRVISLTPLGYETYQSTFPIMLAAEADMMQGFSPAERAMALEFLQRMLNNIRQSDI